MALNELVETNIRYLEKTNDALSQLPTIDVGVLQQFIDMNEFELIYQQIRLFLAGAVEKVRSIIDDVIAAVQWVANELNQLRPVQHLIGLLFRTAQRIATSFNRLGEVIGSDMANAGQLKEFVEMTERGYAFIENLFDELPKKESTDAFVVQLELLKVRLTNLPAQ